MRCKQVEELLPLYAGRELEEKRATLVSEHVQTCAACARVADEYRESVHLTEQFAPPIFSDAVYAGIRQRVLREIETDAMTPAWSQTIADFFKPQLTWAIAAMLLIAASLAAIYFVKTRDDGPQLAVDLPAGVQPGTNELSNSGPNGDKRFAVPPLVNREESSGFRQPGRKRSRGTPANHLNTIASKSPDVSSTVKNVSHLPETLSPPRDSASLVKTLRVEIQTKDPSIRIIWFVQPETKPVIPSSKGI